MITKDRKLIIIAIIVGVVGLGAMIGFIGQGNVRHVEIFWQEKVEQTVVFEDVGGKVQLRGISGIGGESNPYLISRTSFAYILTVINNGDKHHRLYIEGLEIQTNLLEPGQRDVITIYPTQEGIYKYFDKREKLEHLGFLEIKTVVPSDEFTGFLRDLI
ncbi:MAG: cupredoxin domain-containing protein [Nitrosopumilus sp.]|nr:cupredoxin domain-containing protein [Nitrosopumilus sp.]MDH3385548.1 cupredoxin domain-containing protein [Nitrosopumilus sp.]